MRETMTQHPETAAPAKLPGHVLVVEDDAVLGMTIEQALLDAGVARVALCASTEEAMQHLRDGRPEAQSSASLARWGWPRWAWGCQKPVRTGGLGVGAPCCGKGIVREICDFREHAVCILA